jgi:4-hydroxy-3-methylbut-2-en-1-yl diphosphate synthase IspG/GcpE
MASKRQIFVGGVPIGGGAPVAVQTMTKTETANLAATMEQIRTVADAGADPSASPCRARRTPTPCARSSPSRRSR